MAPCRSMSLRGYRPGALCASETDESRVKFTQTPTRSRRPRRGWGGQASAPPRWFGPAAGAWVSRGDVPVDMVCPPPTRQVASQAQRRFPDPCLCVRAPPYSASRCRLTPAPVPRGPTPPSCSATLRRTPGASNTSRTSRPLPPSTKVSPAGCLAAPPPALNV